LKFKVKVNGETKRVETPDSWGQVTYSQYLEVINSKDDLNVLVKIFTGIDCSGATVKGLEQIISSLSFLTQPIKETPLPKEILSYKIPENLEFEELSRYMAIEEILKTFTDDVKENAKRYPEMVAIYAVPGIYSDKGQSDRLIDYFMGAPALEVLAVGNFTILNILGLKNIIPRTAPKGGSLLRRFRRAMTNSLRSLAPMLRYYSWKKSLPTSAKKYLDGR